MSQPKLRRHLSLLDLLILGIAGAVGTGVLFSTAGMAAVAGPSVILAWLIGAIMYLFIGLTYVDLGRRYPEAGGPSRYSYYTYGKTTNMINAFADLIWYVFIPPIEALATVEGLNYFYPHLIVTGSIPTTLGALVAILLMVLFLPFNYFGIRAFARFTNIFGLVKVVLYVLVAIGFVGFAHFGNFTRHGGFTPFGAGGIFAAIPLGMFAFGGIRVIPDYAEEMKHPRLLSKSIFWVVIGQTIIYLLLSLGLLTALNWHRLKITPGHWSQVSQIPGNPFLTIASSARAEWLIAVTLVIAIIGPFVTGYIYQGSGSRVLMAMSRTGIVSQRLKEISERHAIPVWSLLSFTVLGAIIAFIVAPLPSIYNLINDAVVGGYLGFAVNPVVMLALRKQGLPGHLRGGRAIALVGFASASLIVYWNGWPAVPYAAILLALASLIFSLLYRAGKDWTNALWYMAYILFLTAMTFLTHQGWVNTDWGSVAVVVVSLAVFLPWGVASRLPAPLPSPNE